MTLEVWLRLNVKITIVVSYILTMFFIVDTELGDPLVKLGAMFLYWSNLVKKETTKLYNKKL